MRIKETKVYQFSELSDCAKEKARDWYREATAGDPDMLEYVLEDAATCADLLGIDLRTRTVKLMNGMSRAEPNIFYNGFCSQGDGACFEGTWSASRMKLLPDGKSAIAGHAPKDLELLRIADALNLIAAYYPAAYASMKHTGRYCHSGCMSVESEDGIDSWDDEPGAEEKANVFADSVSGELTQLMRDFADWIYKRLEAEHTYQNSDEAVTETIEANEYEFLEDGSRA